MIKYIKYPSTLSYSCEIQIHDKTCYKVLPNLQNQEQFSGKSSKLFPQNVCVIFVQYHVQTKMEDALFVLRYLKL